MSEDLIALARSQVEAFNNADWERLADTIAPNSVYRELGTGRTFTGADEILEANRGWKSAIRDAHGTVTDAFACGDRVALQITWEGTQSGPLPLPGGGEIPPTGRRISVSAIQTIRVADGKITEMHHAFDMLGMLEQLGTISAEAFTAAG